MMMMMSSVEKVDVRSCSFYRDSSNFPSKEIWVFNILIFFLNSSAVLNVVFLEKFFR